MEKIINELIENLRLQEEQGIIDDIIDIYDDAYKNYDEYINSKSAGQFVLTLELFEYIKNKGDQK